MKKITLLLAAGLLTLFTQAANFNHNLPAKLTTLPKSSVTVNEETPVTPPPGIESTMYKFKGYDTYIKQEKESEVFVIFNDNDVYIQGLSVDYLPSGWVKGTLADGVLTVPEAYMGTFEFWGDEYALYFDGATFTYDSATGTFTAADGYTTTAEETVLDEYTNVVLSPAEIAAATPATPQILSFVEDDYGHYVKMDIPLKDTNGNDIYAALLSYQLFYDINGTIEAFTFTEDNYIFLGMESMTIVPYNFTDSYDIDKAGRQVYLYADNIEAWNRVGVKSIYTAGDVTNESPVSWFDINGNVNVTDVEAAKSVVSVHYYDLQGRFASEDATGALIKQTLMDDGSVKTTKVLNR